MPTRPRSTPSKKRLEQLIEEATVDAYGEDEQALGFSVMLDQHLAMPFDIALLGVTVTVERIELTSGSEIVAVCRRGRERLRVPVLELPLPKPAPRGSEWIAAYRRWSSDGRED